MGGAWKKKPEMSRKVCGLTDLNITYGTESNPIALSSCGIVWRRGRERASKVWKRERRRKEREKGLRGGFSFFLDCVLPREFYLVDSPGSWFISKI